MIYPVIRLRRNRKAAWIRELLAETVITPKHLILPVFIIEGNNQQQTIETMPGIYRQSIDKVIVTARKAKQEGIQAIALFPCIEPKFKTPEAEIAYRDDNLICRTIKEVKNTVPELGIICDVALDPYTMHGHDGIVNEYGDVDNDRTLDILCKQAVSLARAGADIVAPSDMMDGRIAAIRKALDIEGFYGVSILSYAVKYSSSFYAPFRDAVGSKTKSYISKATYQMDIRNTKEAMREIEQDIIEGADIIMVKPGMSFLDILYAATSRFDVNVFAYQVGGEYAMLKFAALAGAIDWESAMLESLISLRRAGASAIFTYAALEFATMLNSTHSI